MGVDPFDWRSLLGPDAAAPTTDDALCASLPSVGTEVELAVLAFGRPAREFEGFVPRERPDGRRRGVAHWLPLALRARVHSGLPSVSFHGRGGGRLTPIGRLYQDHGTLEVATLPARTLDAWLAAEDVAVEGLRTALAGPEFDGVYLGHCADDLMGVPALLAGDRWRRSATAATHLNLVPMLPEPRALEVLRAVSALTARLVGAGSVVRVPGVGPIGAERLVLRYAREPRVLHAVEWDDDPSKLQRLLRPSRLGPRWVETRGGAGRYEVGLHSFTLNRLDRIVQRGLSWIALMCAAGLEWLTELGTEALFLRPGDEDPLWGVDPRRGPVAQTWLDWLERFLDVTERHAMRSEAALAFGADRAWKLARGGVEALRRHRGAPPPEAWPAEWNLRRALLEDCGVELRPWHVAEDVEEERDAVVESLVVRALHACNGLAPDCDALRERLAALAGVPRAELYGPRFEPFRPPAGIRHVLEHAEQFAGARFDWRGLLAEPDPWRPAPEVPVLAASWEELATDAGRAPGP